MFRFLIIIGLLVSLIILVSQNLQPIPLVFFGSKTPSLPLAAWVVSFLVAGFFTSLYLQALTKPSSSQPSVKTQPPPPIRDIPPSPPSPRRERTTTRQLEEKTPPSAYIPEDSEPVTSPSPSLTQELDWEDSKVDVDDDWDIEQPPRETTIPQSHQYRRSFVEEQPQKPPSRFERPQQPKTSSHQGTVYSYTYREKEPELKKSPPPENSVYDADFRVIVPPLREPSQTNTEEQEETDWL